MSLFGKFLALLNIFGAIALVCLAGMNYGKRQSWAFSVFRHDLVVRGLPLDENELDVQGRLLAPQIGKATQEDLFRQVGGSPVPTQVAEVQRVKQQFDGLLQAAQSPAQQTFTLARILLPLSDSLLERDQLLACQTWLATPASADRLRQRYINAFRAAVDQPVLNFPDAFRVALRAQPGQPSESLTSLVLSDLPAKLGRGDEVRFGKAFDAASQKQLDQLKARYDEHFARALQATSPEGQKAAIARLLFGLSVAEAEEKVPRNPKEDAALHGERVAGAEPFRTLLRRFFVVCGLSASLDAISDRSAVLRNLAGSLTGLMDQDRQQFVADHVLLLEQVREAAYLVHTELTRKGESERRLTVQKEQAKKRDRDVKALTKELSESRAQTAEKLKELQALSQKLLDDRVTNRDLIRKSEEAEREIRDLERQIRARESSGR